MGLLARRVARTAVVAGTASVVSGRVRRRQDEKFAERDQQIAANRGEGWAEGAQSATPSPPPSPSAPQDDSISQLKQLAELKEQGILTDAEFSAKKAQILGI